jgi:hypothetical protein
MYSSIHCVHRTIKDRYDTEIQNLFMGNNKKNSLLYYCELKHKWSLENYFESVQGMRKVENMAHSQIWKLQEIKGHERRRCSCV